MFMISAVHSFSSPTILCLTFVWSVVQEKRSHSRRAGWFFCSLLFFSWQQSMLDSWRVVTSLPSLHANTLPYMYKRTLSTSTHCGFSLNIRYCHPRRSKFVSGVKRDMGADIGWRDGRLTVWLTQAAGVFVCQGTMEKPMKQFSEGVINSALLPVCVAFAD